MKIILFIYLFGEGGFLPSILGRWERSWEDVKNQIEREK